MDIFVILSLLGGIALFLFGMHQMGDSLEKAAGPKLQGMLERMTRGKMRAVLLGLVITAIIQSSSTTTVMVVGFVNSGIMHLSQAIPVIMGANVGTTVTAWILSLTGIESTTLWMEFLKPSTFTPILAVIGVAMILFSKDSRKRDIGGIMTGFAILMFGMDMMTSAVKPLANDPGFQQIFLMFDNPWLGMMIGAVLTGIIQSSSASVGILQALAATGTITYGMAIPIIMGQNIGTCVTTLLSSIGASKAGRRTALVHLFFNIIGTLVFMILFVSLRGMMPVLNGSASLIGIAVVHTVFNVMTLGLLLPFSGMLERLVTILVPADKTKAEDAPVLLDERLLATPTFALNRCRTIIAQMSDDARVSVTHALGLFSHFDPAIAEGITQSEERVDHYEDILGTFAVKLNKMSLSESEGRDVTRILHGIGDFERISDHALNIMENARELHDKQISFTPNAMTELHVAYLALESILDMAVNAYNRGDVELARRVEPLEEVIDELTRELKLRHVHRVRAGQCTVETGFVFGDLLTNLERVADHCSNLAVCVIELSMGEYNAHAYIEKTGRMEEFVTQYRAASERYHLPAEVV
ncbi:MAG: Na/Pi cotransporter family protein [Clostridia bacterium]